jgi:hypothetical protein
MHRHTQARIAHNLGVFDAEGILKDGVLTMLAEESVKHPSM